MLHVSDLNLFRLVTVAYACLCLLLLNSCHLLAEKCDGLNNNSVKQGSNSAIFLSMLSKAHYSSYAKGRWYAPELRNDLLSAPAAAELMIMSDGNC